MLLDGELTFAITRHTNLVPLVLHTCIGHRKSVFINHTTSYLLLRHHLQGRNHEEDEHQIQFFNTFHYLIIYRGLQPIINSYYFSGCKVINNL